MRSTELGQITWPQLEGDWIMYGREAFKKRRRSDLTGSENGSGKRSAQAKLTEPAAAKWKKMKRFLQPSGGLVSWIHPRKESKE